MATQKFTLKQTAQEVQDILDTATEITWEKEYSTEDFYDESLLNLSGAYYEQDERIKNVALTDAGYAYISATQCQWPDGRIEETDRSTWSDDLFSLWPPVRIPDKVNKFFFAYNIPVGATHTWGMFFWDENQQWLAQAYGDWQANPVVHDGKTGCVIEAPKGAKYFAYSLSDTFVAPSSNNKGKYTFIAIRTEEKALQSFSNPKLKVLSENLGSSVLEGIESRKSYKNIALVPIYIKDQDMVEGSLNPADGTEQVQSERIRTDYIDIANTNGEYQKIFITNTSDIQAGFPLVYCYDESKKFLKMITPKSGDYDEVNCLYGTVADLDSKTRYIRVTTTEACKYYSRIRIFKGEGEVNELKITNPYERPLQNCEIVCFGDSIFGNYQETPTPNQSIPYLIAKQLDCKTYNVGFGGCNLVDRGDGTDWAQFSMTSLTDALVSGNWTAIDAAANGSTVTSYFKDHLATLKSIDFNKVKIALINYGTNDFASRKLDNLEDPKDRTTIKGAYRYCLNELGKKFPTLSFAICSLYKCYDINAEDETVTEKNSGHEGITRVQFNQALKEVADEFGAIYIDNYNLGVNPYNAPVGFFSWKDGTHPTQEGRVMIANRIAHDLSVKMY